MKLIDFNDNFGGFNDNEDILVDTSIILGYINIYDAWSPTVTKLLEDHVFNNDKTLYLYINSAILNEITNFIGKNESIKRYLENNSNHKIDNDEIIQVEKKSIQVLKQLIADDILLMLESNKDSALKQLDLYKELGAADAINASIAHEYAITNNG